MEKARIKFPERFVFLSDFSKPSLTCPHKNNTVIYTLSWQPQRDLTNSFKLAHKANPWIHASEHRVSAREKFRCHHGQDKPPGIRIRRSATLLSAARVLSPRLISNPYLVIRRTRSQQTPQKKRLLVSAGVGYGLDGGHFQQVGPVTGMSLLSKLW
jgi:hypothetical protein